MRAAVLVVLALGCSSPPDGDLLDTEGVWSDAESYNVRESISYTQDAYALDWNGSTVGDLRAEVLPTDGDIVYARGDDYGDAACDQAATTDDLPMEVRGVVTLHPRWYQKLSGCDFADEKYYGNYFIEDDESGIFVVGDSKVAHFDVGDVVNMRVRAVRTNFGLDMVYAHDILSVDRTPRAIKYAMVPDEGLGADDIGHVRRVRGTVMTPPETFGEFTVETEDGLSVAVNLDAELNRRRQYPDVGQTICATGPVLYSFSEYSIVIMNIGQIAVIDPSEPCPDEPTAD